MPSENLENVKLEPIGTNKKQDEQSVLLDAGGAGDRIPDGEADNYEPHLHRQIEKPTTNVETLIHLLKGCLGTGILAMPEAFKFSGMANGIVSTILIGALCTYCLHVLIERCYKRDRIFYRLRRCQVDVHGLSVKYGCGVDYVNEDSVETSSLFYGLKVRAQYVLCKRLKVPLLTYPESMKVACELGPPCLNRFAKYAPDVTNFFLIFYQIGICCVYVVFVGKNLKDVVDKYSGETSLNLYLICIFVPFILIMCIRNLKLLAPFSVVANIITFITFGVVGYYVCQDLPSFSDRPSFGTLFNYPLYFGTTLFSLQAVGVVIALENNMKTPKNFRGTFGVLNVGMSLVTVIYVLMAMMGYWKYGEIIRDSITLNFPPEDILAQVIKVMYSIAIFISYGLQGFVPVQILWTNYIEKHLENKQLFWEYVLRVGCVVVTFVLAATVPLLGLFISLVGAFCLSALGIAFPAIIELCAYWPNNLGPGKMILIKDIILIVIGVIGLCAGSYSCIYSIINELSKGTT